MVAAALKQAFEEIGARVALIDADSYGARPLAKCPGEIIQALAGATVSALAMTTMRGELKARRAVLEAVTANKLRHAHMPSITNEVFIDGLSMDYREISRFIDLLVEVIAGSTALTMTSPAGTNLEVSYPSPPEIDKLDGLIDDRRWQNLPSGQILIFATDANGTYVADRSLGDWFEHKYDVSQYPVSFEFEKGHIRSLSCDNRRLERDLGLFIRSSDNSGRISEMVIGANLGLTQGHTGALFDGYRPGASISIGSTPGSKSASWHSATFLPMTSSRNSIFVAGRQIMHEDSFADDLLAER
jgi:leucyl aminopeptidase (aminopeptidase T)